MTMPQSYGNIFLYEPKPSADQPVKEDNMLDQQKVALQVPTVVKKQGYQWQPVGLLLDIDLLL